MQRVLLSVLLVLAIQCGPALAIPLTNLEVWLNADSLVGANGSAVASWPDDAVADGADNANEFGAANRPTLLTAAPAFNGHNAVRFIETTALSNSTIALMSDFTVFMVYKWNTITNQSWVLEFGQFDPELGIGAPSGGQNTHWAVYDAPTTYHQFATMLQAPDTLYRLTYERNDATDVTTLSLADGPTQSMSVISNAMTSAEYALNSQTGSAYDGLSKIDIAELIIYRSLLQPAERAEVEAYLTAKYVPEPTSGVMAILAVSLLFCRRRSERA